MNLKPLTLYKKQGSLWMKFIEGSITVEGDKTIVNEPAIMLTFCKSIGDKKYDNKNQLKIALTYWDTIRLYRAMLKKFDLPDAKGEKGRSLIHKYGNRTTTLRVGPGQTAGTYGWGIQQREGTDEAKTVSIFSDDDEMFGIEFYFRKSLDEMVLELKRATGAGVPNERYTNTPVDISGADGDGYQHNHIDGSIV